MKLTKNEISIGTAALSALVVFLAVVAAVAMINPALLKRVDYTAAALFVAVATYWFDKRREERRMLASRGVVQAMAVNELRNLQGEIALIQECLPREVTGLESTWRVTAEQIINREDAIPNLAAAVAGLNTPVLDGLNEKLDALPKEQLLALGRILQIIGEIKRAPATAKKLDLSLGSRAPTVIEALLDKTAERCAEVNIELQKLIDEWTAHMA